MKNCPPEGGTLNFFSEPQIMSLPEPFNLAETVLRKYEDAVFRIALQEVKSEGINTYSFGGLDYLSDKFATVLTGSAITQGDVVAVVLPQSSAFAVAHLAVLKMGAIVLPISISTEQSLVERIIEASGAKSLVIDESIQQRFIDLENAAPQVESIFVASDYVSKNDFGEGFRSFWYEVNFADSDFSIVETGATTPAYIFLERNADDNVVTSSIIHGEILEAYKDSDGRLNEPNVFWTTEDWASKQIIAEMLFKVWFQGDAVATYDKEVRNEADTARLFQQLEYTQFSPNNFFSG